METSQAGDVEDNAAEEMKKINSGKLIPPSFTYIQRINGKIGSIDGTISLFSFQSSLIPYPFAPSSQKVQTESVGTSMSSTWLEIVE